MVLQQWARVRGLEPLSLCDWPGKATCVLFLGGCNLNCPTCHNYLLATDDPSLPHLTREHVLEFLHKRRNWLDGVVITGGEPTHDPQLSNLLAELSPFSLPIKVDTNGMRPDVVEALLDACKDLTFAVDVKGPFAMYPELTGHGVDPEQAEARLKRIFDLASERPHSFYFRTTRVPLLCEQDMLQVRNYLPAGFPLIVQEYVAPRRDYASIHSQARRTERDMGGGSNRPCHIESTQGKRHSGSAPGQEACA